MPIGMRACLDLRLGGVFGGALMGEIPGFLAPRAVATGLLVLRCLAGETTWMGSQSVHLPLRLGESLLGEGGSRLDNAGAGRMSRAAKALLGGGLRWFVARGTALWRGQQAREGLQRCGLPQVGLGDLRGGLGEILRRRLTAGGSQGDLWRKSRSNAAGLTVMCTACGPGVSARLCLTAAETWFARL